MKKTLVRTYCKRCGNPQFIRTKYRLCNSCSYDGKDKIMTNTWYDEDGVKYRFSCHYPDEYGMYKNHQQ